MRLTVGPHPGAQFAAGEGEGLLLVDAEGRVHPAQQEAEIHVTSGGLQGRVPLQLLVDVFDMALFKHVREGSPGERRHIGTHGHYIIVAAGGVGVGLRARRVQPFLLIHGPRLDALASWKLLTVELVAPSQAE